MVITHAPRIMSTSCRGNACKSQVQNSMHATDISVVSSPAVDSPKMDPLVKETESSPVICSKLYLPFHVTVCKS